MNHYINNSTLLNQPPPSMIFQITEYQLFNHMLVSDARFYWEACFKNTTFGTQAVIGILNLELSQGILKTTSAIPTIRGILSNTLYQMQMELEQTNSGLIDIGWDPESEVFPDEMYHVNQLDSLLTTQSDNLAMFFASLVSNAASLIACTFPYPIYCQGLVPNNNHSSFTFYLTPQGN